VTVTSDKYTMFANRLAKVYKHRAKLAKKQGITCYRLYDLDMPEFPFCIDLYDGHAYIAEYKRNHQLSEEDHKMWIRISMHTISEALGIDSDHLYLKERKVIEDRTEQYNKVNAIKKEIIVTENNYNFIVNLSDYLDTGLFLDHRLTRKMVGEWSNGAHVLNLFAYTGSFSVYAAMNGATQVDTVDLSNTYIDWAKRNFEANNISSSNHNFFAADVLQWLPKARSNFYDIIVCDPPTFSNSKKMIGILDTQRDHVSIINQCLRTLKPGGKLVFSTNFTKFKIDIDAIQSKNIKDVTRMTSPFDFEGKLDRWCYIIVKDNPE
jgi:23S rRNA (cytosine1962-C5)-methyltransferase